MALYYSPLGRIITFSNPDQQVVSDTEVLSARHDHDVNQQNVSDNGNLLLKQPYHINPMTNRE